MCVARFPSFPSSRNPSPPPLPVLSRRVASHPFIDLVVVFLWYMSQGRSGRARNCGGVEPGWFGWMISGLVVLWTRLVLWQGVFFCRFFLSHPVKFSTIYEYYHGSVSHRFLPKSEACSTAGPMVGTLTDRGANLTKLYFLLLQPAFFEALSARFLIHCPWPLPL